jgi:hypothetical protein
MRPQSRLICSRGIEETRHAVTISTILTPKTEKPRGVLKQSAPAGEIVHQRYQPSAELAGYVEHFWSVHWELDPGAIQKVETLPHPSVHLVFEQGATVLEGIRKAAFSRVLQGKGFVFAVKFRPASFHDFYEKPLTSITNRSMDPAKVFGASFLDLEANVLRASPPAERLAQYRKFSSRPITSRRQERGILERSAVADRE